MIIARDLFKQIKPYISSPEAIIITGMRRVGKTTLLEYISDYIDSDNKLFIDLENPLNQKLFEEKNYERIMADFESRGLKLNKRAYVFLDEIHFSKKLPSVVKYLYDHYKIKFFLTGSASYYLKNFFSESLAGRKYIFELYPLNFREFLRFKGSRLKVPAVSDKIGEATHEIFALLYEEYLRYGGFPGVVLKENISEKKKSLEAIFSSYYQLEVLQLSDYRNVSAVRDLILLLAQRTGSKLDIFKLSKELGIARETVNNYLSFLEGTYFIKLIRPFSRNKDTEIRQASKAYLADSGLLNILGKIDEGKIFENNIFQNLRLKGELNYYQRKNGSEIDFILNKAKAYEAKVSPDERDEKKLAKLCASLKIKEYKVISRNHSELDNIIYGFMV